MPDPVACADPNATLQLRVESYARRRASVRYPVPAGTGALIRSADRTESGWVVNVSGTGLGVLLGRPLCRETPLLVEIHGAPGGLAARVVHSTPQAEG
jgi:hypothetical protein